jgi:hypothetical protein
MITHMITRDANGCITGRIPISVSAILYKNELINFMNEHNLNIKYNRSIKPFKEFQFDFLVKQRNQRKQKAILKHKKLQSKW